MRSTNHNIGLLILRLTLGLLLLLHGIAKLIHGIDPIKGMVASTGLPAFLGYSVYIGEVIFPLLLIVGYRTRLAAIGFALNMVAAIHLAHAADVSQLNSGGGWGIELQALYLFGALALVFTGGGKYAISHRRTWD